MTTTRRTAGWCIPEADLDKHPRPEPSEFRTLDPNYAIYREQNPTRYRPTATLISNPKNAFHSISINRKKKKEINKLYPFYYKRTNEVFKKRFL